MIRQARSGLLARSEKASSNPRIQACISMIPADMLPMMTARPSSRMIFRAASPMPVNRAGSRGSGHGKRSASAPVTADPERGWRYMS
jgi:hypothetical protein